MTDKKDLKWFMLKNEWMKLPLSDEQLGMLVRALYAQAFEEDAQPTFDDTLVQTIYTMGHEEFSIVNTKSIEAAKIRSEKSKKAADIRWGNKSEEPSIEDAKAIMKHAQALPKQSLTNAQGMPKVCHIEKEEEEEKEEEQNKNKKKMKKENENKKIGITMNEYISEKLMTKEQIEEKANQYFQ